MLWNEESWTKKKPQHFKWPSNIHMCSPHERQKAARTFCVVFWQKCYTNWAGYVGFSRTTPSGAFTLYNINIYWDNFIVQTSPPCCKQTTHIPELTLWLALRYSKPGDPGARHRFLGHRVLGGHYTKWDILSQPTHHTRFPPLDLNLGLHKHQVGDVNNLPRYFIGRITDYYSFFQHGFLHVTFPRKTEKGLRNLNKYFKYTCIYSQFW
jgi:hypothetical protein